MIMSPGRLGIDFGTSHTVVVVSMPDGRRELLLFDSSPLLAACRPPARGWSHEDHIESIAFTSDSSMIATGGQDHTIRLWRTT